MICIDFCVIYKYRVKQLMIFERTVAAASDFKNCTMVNCVVYLYVNGSGSITSLGEERANLSAVVYL